MFLVYSDLLIFFNVFLLFLILFYSFLFVVYLSNWSFICVVIFKDLFPLICVFIFSLVSLCFIIFLSVGLSGFGLSRLVSAPVAGTQAGHGAPPAASGRLKAPLLCGFRGCLRAVNLNTSRQISLWSEAFSLFWAAEPRNVSNDPGIIR